MGNSVRAWGPAGFRALAGIALLGVSGTLLMAFAFATPAGRARPWIPEAAAAPVEKPSIGLRVIPFPGTPDAAPQTQVIFSALRPSDLSSLRVTGSRTGFHSGRLSALPAGAGTAFVPSRRFAPGETVRVSAGLRTPSAGTASGAPGATRLSFSFRVGALQSSPVARRRRSLARGGTTGIGSTQHFHSEPNLRPPVITTTRDPDSSSGDIFLAMQNTPQAGPMILSGKGQLIWFHDIGPGNSTVFPSDLALQHYHGQPVLTWWQGQQLGPGEDVLMDRSYKTVAVVHAGDGYQADFHEFQLTPQGTALLDATDFATANLTSVGGPSSGTVLDDVIQEVDISTGRVLWEWHSLGHVPVSASYMTYSPSQGFYDYFHLNSIQQLPDGNLLISARHTWSVYEIDRRTGKIIWTLGGKDSSFRMGPGTKFAWQHDARLRGDQLSLFDDGSYPPVERQSSAKYLRVDTSKRTVSLIRRFTHAPPVLSGAAGSAQRLPNGNLFVGWGEVPEFSEFTASGRQIFNGSFALGTTSYRAYRFPWVGRPQTRPSLAVSRSASGHMKLYASWNGATQVAAWRVLGGSSPGHLKAVGVTASRTGFETAIKVSAGARYFAAQALNGKGRVLGTSAPARG